MKCTTIVSLATFAATVDLATAASDHGEQSLRRAKTSKEPSKSGKVFAKASKSAKSVKSDKCKDFDGLLCNDYATYSEGGYEYGWGIKNMDGAELMSPLPKLNPKLREHLGDPVDHDPENPDFMNTLKAVGMHPGLGGGTFGDLGYDNPGRGGVNNFDIFNLVKNMKFTAWGQYYTRVDAEGNTVSCLDPNDDTGCTFNGYNGGFGSSDESWWSNKEDSKNLTVVESKDQVSQVCWYKGEAGIGTFDQGMHCEFKEGTRIMVAMGSWRATDGPLASCDAPPDGTAWANPQKVVKPDVYQYLIPLGYNGTTTDYSLSPVDVGACHVCPNKEYADETFADLSKCWPVQ